MKKEELKDFQNLCQQMLVLKMLDYVREHGEDVTDYERNEFGLEDTEDSKITKVLNFFDNGGCVFTLNNGDSFVTHAVLCLYIEEYNGKEYLMSYSLYNDGTEYDSDESEPDHESMLNDSLEFVCQIANVIIED